MRHAMWLGLTLCLMLCTDAKAQSEQPRWEAEFHGGGMWPKMPSKGTFALPPVGTIAASGARPVPSWFFGDGASQLNQSFFVRITGTLAPLDSMLQGPIVERKSGGAFGARISYRFTRRFAAELTVDSMLGELALTSATTAALEAARASFVTAMNGLFTSPLIVSRTVNATAALSNRQSRQIMTTGALLFHPLPAARLSPYVAVGAGGVSHLDTPPSAQLTGTYDFVLGLGAIAPPPSLRQTDTLTVQSSIDSGLVWMFGGGVKYPISPRWGLRLDVRDYLRSNTISTRVDTSPSTLPLTNFGTLFLQSGSNVPIFFSGAAGASTLSVPLQEFTTFTGTGLEHQISATAGVIWRF